MLRPVHFTERPPTTTSTSTPPQLATYVPENDRKHQYRFAFDCCGWIVLFRIRSMTDVGTARPERRRSERDVTRVRRPHSSAARCRRREPTSVDAAVRRRQRPAFDTRPQIAVLLPRPVDTLLSSPWPPDLPPISIPERVLWARPIRDRLQKHRGLSRDYVLSEVLNRITL